MFIFIMLTVSIIAVIVIDHIIVATVMDSVTESVIAAIQDISIRKD